METNDENVKDGIDFYSDAQEFLNSQIPKEFNQNLQNYIKDKGYNKNDQMLFNFMLEKAIGFHATIVFLKSDKN